MISFRFFSMLSLKPFSAFETCPFPLFLLPNLKALYRFLLFLFFSTPFGLSKMMTVPTNDFGYA